MRKPAAVLFVLSLAVLALALVPAAGLAAKGGNSAAWVAVGGKPGGGGGRWRQSKSLAVVDGVRIRNGNGCSRTGTTR